MPACGYRATVNKPPLPLGEGWSEGDFAFQAKQVAHTAHALMANFLIQHRFPPKHASQRSALALKIAKRQSLSRVRNMAAIVANSQVKSSELGAVTQGR